MTPEEQIQYEKALKRVKKIKGFYTHLLVYVVINLIFVVVNIQDLEKGESYFQFKNFFTAFFWGIGLAAHALSVFGPNLLLGNDWEEKKIKELMEKEKSEKQKWN
ncbi:2TM domain-containing protein [Flavobacterium sp.]|uniref:2TM domain-containing protein n=1 Tax=Flavobacterium sp. TaxID=239 RepID=UPI0026319716|nr:2TM domain-containing protein [Flavobacterium sp.]